MSDLEAYQLAESDEQDRVFERPAPSGQPRAETERVPDPQRRRSTPDP